MDWKFWKKEKPVESAGAAKEAKLGKPRDLPERVGIHLVTKLKEEPDWTWSLKAVLRPIAAEKHASDIRVFSPADASRAGVIIANYNSLDAHPELILFAGTFNKNTGSVKIEKILKNVA